MENDNCSPQEIEKSSDGDDFDFRLINAERLAAETIEKVGICTPEHIRIRDIAFTKGAVVVEQKLQRAAARIVKIGNSATIRFQSDERLERKRFSIAHELGHLLMHHVESLKNICSEADMMNWYQTNIETQAFFCKRTNPSDQTGQQKM